MKVLQAPPLEIDAHRGRTFEATWRRTTPGGEILYELSYPKWEFLAYLLDRHDVLLRGTNLSNVGVFRPVPQTDYFGRLRRGVFAASDPIWPMFFAIVDRTAYHGSLSNSCTVSHDVHGRAVRQYAFSLNAIALARRPWTTGAVYMLPRAGFSRVLRDDGTSSEEWVSDSEVSPVAHITVAPPDFPFLEDIGVHGDETWHQFEELAYRLARGASRVVFDDAVLTLSFDIDGQWHDPVAPFRGLSARLLPELEVTVTSKARGLVVEVSGPQAQLRQIAGAYVSWRA